MTHTATVIRVLLLIWVIAQTAQIQSNELSVLPAKINGEPPGRMMYKYLTGKAMNALDRRLGEYEKLKSPEDVVAYQNRLRDFYLQQLGPFPQRTPLQARVVEVQPRDGYRVEKIIFQSRPGMFVTALLYLPDDKQPGLKNPYPGILVPCGHSVNGKMRDLYQLPPILLAKSGMAALCYDPIDQGERCQLLDKDGKPLFVSVAGHNQLGVGSILLGRNTASFRIWDGMRAIDYLQSRKEIDPKRIGCTGISGGGTMTSYLMALDDRVQVAAPGCYLTGFRRLLETIGPADAEQNIHAQIAFGMDHADYAIMRAPKPTLIMTTTDDYFDIDGAWDLFRQAKRVYGRLGFAERVDMIEAPGKHGFPPEFRVAATRWMRRWLLGIDDAVIEPKDMKALADEELRCTPRGQVMLLDGARSAYDFNMDEERELAKARKQYWKKTPQDKALEEVRRIANIRRLKDIPRPKYKKVATLKRDGYRIDKLIIEPEKGVWLPALAYVPQRHDREAYLLLNSLGKQEDVMPGGPILHLVEKGHLVLAVDLRGYGETVKTGKPKYSPNFAPNCPNLFLAYMLGKPYLAMRTEDILVSARLLRDMQADGGSNNVHLISVGATGPASIHAAALEPELFASVTLQKCLRSWADVVNTPTARLQLENAVHGALKKYDLPDLLATLPAEKLKVIEPLDAENKLIDGK
ncbi:MAG: acetylxylan esterase [Pirellulales bacterium]|nr:acetylxylan esterase [Pirellulales bacterium]